MKITVYTVTDCQFSKLEREYLTANKLTYEEKNLETNKEFLSEMLTISNNFAGTPVTKIEKDDGTIAVLKGFTKEEFDKTLGLTPPVTTPTPPQPVTSVTQPTVTPPTPPVVQPTPPVEQPPAPPPQQNEALSSIMSDLQSKVAEGSVLTPVVTAPPVTETPVQSPPPVSTSPAQNLNDPMNSILNNLQNKAGETAVPVANLPNIPNPDFGNN